MKNKRVYGVSSEIESVSNVDASGNLKMKLRGALNRVFGMGMLDVEADPDKGNRHIARAKEFFGNERVDAYWSRHKDTHISSAQSGDNEGENPSKKSGRPFIVSFSPKLRSALSGVNMAIKSADAHIISIISSRQQKPDALRLNRLCVAADCVRKLRTDHYEMKNSKDCDEALRAIEIVQIKIKNTGILLWRDVRGHPGESVMSMLIGCVRKKMRDSTHDDWKLRQDMSLLKQMHYSLEEWAQALKQEKVTFDEKGCIQEIGSEKSSEAQSRQGELAPDLGVTLGNSHRGVSGRQLSSREGSEYSDVDSEPSPESFVPAPGLGR